MKLPKPDKKLPKSVNLKKPPLGKILAGPFRTNIRATTNLIKEGVPEVCGYFDSGEKSY